jgi:hypothetical protein
MLHHSNTQVLLGFLSEGKRERSQKSAEGSSLYGKIVTNEHDLPDRRLTFLGGGIPMANSRLPIVLPFVHVYVGRQGTKRLTDEVRVTGETNLTIFDQETANLRLGYEKTVMLFEEQTKESVAAISAEAAKEVSQFRAELRKAQAFASVGGACFHTAATPSASAVLPPCCALLECSFWLTC